MKSSYLWWIVIICLVLGMGTLMACNSKSSGGGGGGGDDDDDDDGVWTCAEACSVIYNSCGLAITYDGMQLTEAECAQGCDDEGGLSSCEVSCLDGFATDSACETFANCVDACWY